LEPAVGAALAELGGVDVLAVRETKLVPSTVRAEPVAVKLAALLAHPYSVNTAALVYR
jgi:hypothetical protein